MFKYASVYCFNFILITVIVIFSFRAAISNKFELSESSLLCSKSGRLRTVKPVKKFTGLETEHRQTARVNRL